VKAISREVAGSNAESERRQRETGVKAEEMNQSQLPWLPTASPESEGTPGSVGVSRPLRDRGCNSWFVYSALVPFPLMWAFRASAKSSLLWAAGCGLQHVECLCNACVVSRMVSSSIWFLEESYIRLRCAIILSIFPFPAGWELRGEYAVCI